MSELTLPASVTADLTVLICEQHPWEQMGHDECAGPGMAWNTLMLDLLWIREHADELLTLATLRGDNVLPHPSDDPKLWYARMQTAWDELEASLAKTKGVTE